MQPHPPPTPSNTSWEYFRKGYNPSSAHVAIKLIVS